MRCCTKYVFKDNSGRVLACVRICVPHVPTESHAAGYLKKRNPGLLIGEKWRSDGTELTERK